MSRLNVAVIGANAMGSRLTELAAAAGYDTVLEDLMPARLRQAATRLNATGSLSDSGLSPAGLVRFATSVEDAVRTADLIVDFVPDELESKLEILSLIDRMAPPRAMIVTSTERLSIADLASCTYRSDHCLGVRFDSLELLQGEQLHLVFTSRTDANVLERVTDFWLSLGLLVDHELDPAEASVNAGTLF